MTDKGAIHFGPGIRDSSAPTWFLPLRWVGTPLSVYNAPLDVPGVDLDLRVKKGDLPCREPDREVRRFLCFRGLLIEVHFMVDSP